jgi:hypothetical protein
MEDDMVFQPAHQNSQFQMSMRTKWLLLEHIAAQKVMPKEQLKPEIEHESDLGSSEGEFHRN